MFCDFNFKFTFCALPCLETEHKYESYIWIIRRECLVDDFQRIESIWKLAVLDYTFWWLFQYSLWLLEYESIIYSLDLFSYLLLSNYTMKCDNLHNRHKDQTSNSSCPIFLQCAGLKSKLYIYIYIHTHTHTYNVCNIMKENTGLNLEQWFTGKYIPKNFQKKW